jgi:hypothetical protein
LAAPSPAVPVEPTAPTIPDPSKPVTPPVPAQGSLAYLDYKNGFRDLRFGSGPQKDMIPTEVESDLKIYRRVSDEMTIGGATLDQIRYAYYKNKLIHVLLRTKVYQNSRALLEVLRQAYGRGHRPNQFMERCYWFGAVVSASYDENSLTNDAIILLSNKALEQEHRTDRENRAKKGASGL